MGGGLGNPLASASELYHILLAGIISKGTWEPQAMVWKHGEMTYTVCYLPGFMTECPEGSGPEETLLQRSYFLILCLFWDHTRQCSGIFPDSVLRDLGVA